MMMIYGMFVFELRTLPHQQLQHNKNGATLKMNASIVRPAGSISGRVTTRSRCPVCFIPKLPAVRFPSAF